MSYVVLGHASERIEKRERVPAGCVLILSEECGVQGTFPHTLYSVFSNKANRHLFEHPIKHKKELEFLFRKPISIYVENDEYPSISYTLLNYSYSNENLQVEPSGVYELPASEENWAIYKEKRGLGRHTLEAKGNVLSVTDIKQVLKGAVFPNIQPTESLSLQDILKHKDLKISQAKLFEQYPGIYYNFLCRTLPEEEEVLKTLLSKYFPGKNIFKNDQYNRIQVVEDFIKGKKQEAGVKEIREILFRIRDARRKSLQRRKYNINQQRVNRLAHLLGASHVSRDVHKYIDNLNKDTIDIVDRHDGYTPLMSACVSGHTSIVRKLLSKGADVNVSDYDGVTPFMLACSGPYPKIATLLIENGANIKAESDDGVTALHIASEKHELHNVVTHMLKKGADPNAVDDDGDTALHVAASNDMTANLNSLIYWGGDVNRTNKEGRTPLMEAIIEKSEHAARLLLRYSELDLRSAAGTTALGYALKAKLDDIAIKLIQSGITVSNWEAVNAYAKKEGMRELYRFVQTIMESPGFEKESSSTDRVAMVRCFKQKNECFKGKTRKHCLKPCSKTRSYRNRGTLRCRSKSE